VQFSLAFGGGYPLPVGPLTLTAGALVTYTPVPWESEVTGDSGTSSLFSALANGTGVYPIVDRLSARASLGLGIQVLTGADDPGNVLIEPGSMATGALSMFNLRVSAGAEYGITDNIVVSVHPVVFAYSPAKSGMREDIDALTRFEILAGVGYQL
jgi:hypothetical protein